MNDETIVAVYDTHAHAELATADLKAAGISASAISVHANSTSTAKTAAPRQEGFWASLFGGSPDHDTSVYERSVDSGSSVVSVSASGADTTKVMSILESHAPIDIDERAASYGVTPTDAPTAAASDDKLQLSEENLAVGKRVVNRGGTRIRRFVVETPVEQSVNLHSERVVLERHPVTDGREVGDSFGDKTIEMTEMAEEAVVTKTAHVYEEVGLRKEASDRVETVRDTLRKEEVEVEEIPATATTTTPGSLKPVMPKV